MTSVVSGLVKSTISRVVSSSSAKDSTDYTLGERVDRFEGCSPLWSLYEGTYKPDGSKVSVFVSKRSLDFFPVALNAFKKARTIRHPDFLKFISGKEFPDHVHIVTEQVQPLVASDTENEDLKLWGCYKIATTLQFLNVDAKFIHGNVALESVFVTPAGEWKLGGFEMLCSVQEENPTLMSYARLIHRNSLSMTPPEVNRGGWGIIKNFPPGTSDSWQYAHLVSAIYNGAHSGVDIRNTPGQVPPALHRGIRELLNPDPASRLPLADFISNGLLHPAAAWFKNPFIEANLFLENVAIKELPEKEAFFRGLEKDIDRFPDQFRKNKILPQLLQAVEYGAASPKVLGLILRIGKSVSDRSQVSAVVVKLFANQDRAIRFSLIQHLDPIIEWLADKRTINDKIFPQLVSGFQDTIPQLREETIKACQKLAPKLNHRNINTELVKHLTALQSDADASVRTNATVCLGTIARYLSDSTKRKTLIPSFGTAVRDPFAPTRGAALQALVACHEYFTAEDHATRLVPGVAPLVLDRDSNVRNEAIRALNLFVGRLCEKASELPECDTTKDDPNQAGSVQQVANQVASGVTGWSGWNQISSYTKRLWNEDGERTTEEGNGQSPSGSTVGASQTPVSSSSPSLQTEAKEVKPVNSMSMDLFAASLPDIPGKGPSYAGSAGTAESGIKNSATTFQPKATSSLRNDFASFRSTASSNSGFHSASSSPMPEFGQPTSNTLSGGGMKLGLKSDPFADLGAWEDKSPSLSSNLSSNTRSSMPPAASHTSPPPAVKPPPGYNSDLSALIGAPLIPSSTSKSKDDGWGNDGWGNDDWGDALAKPKKPSPKKQSISNDDWEAF